VVVSSVAEEEGEERTIPTEVEIVGGNIAVHLLERDMQE